ncbi:hypothetical protein H2201_005382 [Coniosporium apollinis]|uniref:Uncharacterized protein n=1 Tax=Coniosporium apollinis TaxID=61459 RepID=A0ABQ9NV13_9PEZI|nr:hypothetical protein H2201_005382 [Coniosporium apollinis]
MEALLAWIIGYEAAQQKKRGEQAARLRAICAKYREMSAKETECFARSNERLARNIEQGNGAIREAAEAIVALEEIIAGMDKRNKRYEALEREYGWHTDDGQAGVEKPETCKDETTAI